MTVTTEEINIAKYVRIMRSGKKLLVVCGVLGALVAGGIYTYKTGVESLFAETYQAKVLLKVGLVERIPAQHPVEQPQDLVSRIHSGQFIERLPLKAVHAKGTNIIEVSTQSENREEAVNALSESIKDILAYLQSIEQFQKEAVQNEISLLKKSVGQVYAAGQNASMLELKITQLQAKLQEVIPSAIEKPMSVTALKNRPMRIFECIVILGAGLLAGWLIGLYVVFFKAWWSSNKTDFVH